MSKYEEGFFSIPVTITFGALCSMKDRIKELEAEKKDLEIEWIC